MKIGVIGVGHMGKYHVNVLSSIQNIELAAVSDLNYLSIKPLADQYAIQAFQDYHDMLPLVDAVHIATPANTHYQICKEVLLAGKHVLVEKPITQNYEEALELFNIADTNHVILQVGHVERFNSAVIEVRKIIQNPLLIETHRMQPASSRNIESGAVMELMIHDIDLVLMLINSPITKVHAVGKRVQNRYEDIAHAQLVFENGCIATLTVSRVTEQKIRQMDISQEDSFITVDFATQDVLIHRSSNVAYIVDPKKIGYRQESLVERVSIHRDNPLRLECINFISTIQNGNGKNENRVLDLLTLETTLLIENQIQND